MTAEQKKAAADFMAVRKTAPTGPFSVMLRVPELMDLTFKWRLYLTTKPTLDTRVIELGIMVTARHWTQQYEWNAHYPAAIKAGVKAEAPIPRSLKAGVLRKCPKTRRSSTTC